MNKKGFISNNLFRKALRRNFKQVKQQERICPDKVNDSWKAIEELLYTTATPPQAAKRRQAPHQLMVASSIAAAILLVISFSFWQANTTTGSTSEEDIQLRHLFVPKGKTAQVRLSDGSQLYINAGSHVIYPTVFQKNQREISVEGEVYLEVAHNPKRPFIVKYKDFSVRVLGTKFNISDYSNGKPATVVLVKGSVQIETAQKEKVLLHPNELANITSEGTHVQQVDVSKYTSWKDHFILLDEEKLGEVLDRLSSYYGTNIHCDAKVMQLTLSGKLDLNNSLEQAIRIIHKTTGLQYKKRDDGFYLYK